MLPSEIIKQVKRLQVRTGRQVADVLAGAYTSVFKGRGVEFDEVRPYVPGDDVRTIDWNVTARSGSPFVKRFVEERELTIMLLVDVSASLDFGSGSRSKREAAAELSALIAFSAIQNNDKTGLLLFHGETELYIPPRKGTRHALRVLREVLAHGHVEQSKQPETNALWRDTASLWSKSVLKRLKVRDPRRKTDISAAIEYCRKVIHRRAVIFVVSDFLDDHFMPALRSANRKHDVVAVRMTDSRERSPLETDAGCITLTDAETGEEVLVDTGSEAFRRLSAEKSATNLEALKKDMVSANIDMIEMDAADSLIEPLVAFFRMRKKRAAR